MICSTRNHSSTTQQIWMVRAQGVYRKTQLKCQLLGEDFLDHPNFQENQGILYSPPSYKTLRRARLIMRLCMLSQLCPTFCNPMDCSPPSSSVHGILQARILDWVAMPFSWFNNRNDFRAVLCHLVAMLHFCYHRMGKQYDWAIELKQYHSNMEISATYILGMIEASLM